MFAGGISTTLAGSYMSVPAEIDAADLAFSELEKELQAEIDAIETTYPDYDEYRYNLASIGHDPFALISYLSAVHTEFTASEVQAEIEYLFDEMYELTLNPTEETRTRTVTKTGTHTVTDPVTGETTEEEYEYEVEEEYTVTISAYFLHRHGAGVLFHGGGDKRQGLSISGNGCDSYSKAGSIIELEKQIESKSVLAKTARNSLVETERQLKDLGQILKYAEQYQSNHIYLNPLPEIERP